jgi:ferric-dicitrate binding protein FerR (iron transport regulator)
MESEERINVLFLRYLEGESLNETEAEELSRLMNLNTDRREVFAAFYRIWCASNPQTRINKESLAAEWEQLERRIHQSRSGKIIIRPFLRQAMKIAASLLVGLGLGIGGYAVFQDTYLEKQAIQSIDVPLGSRSTILLSDGTKVTLNAGSRLSLADGFGNNNREVSLEGEGYFVIAHNPRKVFRVKTSGMVVNAYGTVFNVKAYPGEKSAETTLIEGSVGVQLRNGKHNQVYLKPGDQVTLYKKENAVVRKKIYPQSVAVTPPKPDRLIISRSVDTSLYTSWITNRLVLAGEPMQELAVKLERKYDVNISFEDPSLRELRFTGTIENETVEQVMAAISISSAIDFRVDGRDIYLFRQNNPKK